MRQNCGTARQNAREKYSSLENTLTVWRCSNLANTHRWHMVQMVGKTWYEGLLVDYV